MRPWMDRPATRALSLACSLALVYVMSGGIASAEPATGGTAFASTTLPVPVVIPAVPIVGIPVHTSIHPRRLDLNVLDGHAVDIAGVLYPGSSRGVVMLQVRRGARWLTVARALTASRGKFLVHYIPHRPISEPARLRFGGAAGYRPSLRLLGRLNVYRAALASWYGGGGNLACGGMLTSSTMGVANKTLPCGTLVTLRYRRRIVRVPVIDRGPYVAGREFDLTEATKRALGFEGVGVLWSTS